MNILPHIFGVLALGSWVSSVQAKKKSNILVFQLLANIFFAIQYFLLGYFSTCLMDLISALRCFVFGVNAKKNKNNPFSLLLFFIFIIIFLALLYCKSPLSWIPVLATLLYTISTWQNNTQFLRYIFIIDAIFYMFYNYIVGAYVSLLGNLFEIISGTISIFRFKKKLKNSN